MFSRIISMMLLFNWKVESNSISYLDFISLTEVTVGKGSFQNATDSQFESISNSSVILIRST